MADLFQDVFDLFGPNKWFWLFVFEPSYIWHTADMDPLPAPWKDDLVLVGDAAHPLLPFSTQGVNSALVDAATLGAAMGAKGICASALARWGEQRSRSTATYLEYGRARARGFVDPRNSPGEPPFPEHASRSDLEAMQLEVTNA